MDKPVVAHISYEAFPFAKYGGLGDVVGSLPVYLGKQGLRNVVIIPDFHGAMKTVPAEYSRRVTFSLEYLGYYSAVEAKVAHHRGVEFVFVDCPHYFNRDGIYHNAIGRPYSDSTERASFFSKAAVKALAELEIPVNTLFMHDWYGSAALAYFPLDQRRTLKAYFVVHNFQFHGIVPPHELPRLEEPIRIWLDRCTSEGLPPSVGCAAALYADGVVVVSPTYRDELLQPILEHHIGNQVFQLIDRGNLHGFLNGIDHEVWTPRWNVTDIKDLLPLKRKLKGQLLSKNPTLVPERPLALMMNRLVKAKGIYHFIDREGGIRKESLPELTRLFERVNLIICGQPGENPVLTDKSFKTLASLFPTSVVYLNEYSEDLAHELLAASDLFLLPSLFEPCGLTQMYAMAYGSIPVVSATGGLKDSVCDESSHPGSGTGFLFSPSSLHAMTQAFLDAAACFENKSVWEELVGRAYRDEHSWETRQRPYRDLIEGARC